MLGKSGEFRYSETEDHFDRLKDCVVEYVESQLGYNREFELKKTSDLKRLLCAAECGDKEIVDLLIENNSKIVNKRGGRNEGKYNGYTALLLALINRRFAIVESLLKKGANPNLRSSGNRPLLPLLFTVGTWRNKAALEMMLLMGANPNTCDGSGQYPLMTAVDWFLDDLSRESANEISLLLKNGASVEYKPPKYLVSVREYLMNHENVPPRLLKLLKIKN